ncbi:hypothetical protein CWI38_1889p0010 [Hamiltosporidium tvaerminnensis]|uniref:Uncharacterized protein n=1 Tax=Hamiltosporidium tvaerminnensis TaxID=1176355 RepID=A0A4Q9LPC6_9MICR|nr:hypothetical protein CWI38_1889p0010 [Hamiltosporidium tvaerminnensis]
MVEDEIEINLFHIIKTNSNVDIQIYKAIEFVKLFQTTFPSKIAPYFLKHSFNYLSLHKKMLNYLNLETKTRFLPGMFSFYFKILKNIKKEKEHFIIYDCMSIYLKNVLNEKISEESKKRIFEFFYFNKIKNYKNKTELLKLVFEKISEKDKLKFMCINVLNDIEMNEENYLSLNLFIKNEIFDIYNEFIFKIKSKSNLKSEAESNFKHLTLKTLKVNSLFTDSIKKNNIKDTLDDFAVENQKENNEISFQIKNIAFQLEIPLKTIDSLLKIQKFEYDDRIYDIINEIYSKNYYKRKIIESILKNMHLYFYRNIKNPFIQFLPVNEFTIQKLTSNYSLENIEKYLEKCNKTNMDYHMDSYNLLLKYLNDTTDLNYIFNSNFNKIFSVKKLIEKNYEKILNEIFLSLSSQSEKNRNFNRNELQFMVIFRNLIEIRPSNRINEIIKKFIPEFHKNINSEVCLFQFGLLKVVLRKRILNRKTLKFIFKEFIFCESNEVDINSDLFDIYGLILDDYYLMDFYLEEQRCKNCSGVECNNKGCKPEKILEKILLEPDSLPKKKTQENVNIIEMHQTEIYNEFKMKLIKFEHNKSKNSNEIAVNKYCIFGFDKKNVSNLLSFLSPRIEIQQINDLDKDNVYVLISKIWDILILKSIKESDTSILLLFIKMIKYSKDFLGKRMQTSKILKNIIDDHKNFNLLEKSRFKIFLFFLLEIIRNISLYREYFFYIFNILLDLFDYFPNMKKKIDSDNIKNEEIKARCSDYIRALPPKPTIYNKTHSPSSTTLYVTPVSLIDSAPPSSCLDSSACIPANTMENLNAPAIPEGNRLMVLHSILDSVTAVEQEWLDLLLQQMPRNGWSAILRYYNRKFGRTVDIDAEGEISLEKKRERCRIKEIGDVAIRTRKLPSEFVESKVLELKNRITGKYAEFSVHKNVCDAARIIQAAHNEALNVYEKKITMHESRRKFRKENRMFEIFRVRFYLGLTERVESEHVVYRDEISEFWSTMWNKNDKVVTYDEYLIPFVSDTHQTTFPLLEEFIDIINWLPNWKAAGIDKLTSFHKYLYDIVKVICLEGTAQADCQTCVTKVVQIEVKTSILSDNSLGAVRGYGNNLKETWIYVEKTYDPTDPAYFTQCIENLYLPY